MQDIAEIRDKRSHEARELSCLRDETASLAEASTVQKQELGALGCAQSKLDKEIDEFRAQFA
jgi:hypothetical protein